MRGLGITLVLTVIAMVIGIVLGVLLAVCRLSANPLLRSVSGAYIWFFRGTPTLVQLIFFYNLSALLPAISFGIPFGPEFVVVRHQRPDHAAAGRHPRARPQRRRLHGRDRPRRAALGRPRPDARPARPRHDRRSDHAAGRPAAGDAVHRPADRQPGHQHGEGHRAGQCDRAVRPAVHGAGHLQPHVRDDPAC